MRYMIVECRRSYAVALAEDGRFLRVANLNYTIGQTVDEVFEMNTPAKRSTAWIKWVSGAVAVAACLCLVVTVIFQFMQSPIGSVYLCINPEVRIDVGRGDRVIDLVGVNTDGQALVEDFTYWRGMHLDDVSDALIDRAIAMGFLTAGGEITLVLDGEDAEWVTTTGATLGKHIGDHIGSRFAVNIRVEQTDVTTAAEYPQTKPTPATTAESETTRAPEITRAFETTLAPVTTHVPETTAPPPITTMPRGDDDDRYDDDWDDRDGDDHDDDDDWDDRDDDDRDDDWDDRDDDRDD